MTKLVTGEPRETWLNRPLNKNSESQPGASLAAVRYVIITPARNEEENIEQTIQTVAGQTNPPAEWIIVNDGSTDKTAAILDAYAAKYPWLRVIHLSDRGYREPGGGVIRTFNQGLSQLQSKDWEFIVKLDGDLHLPLDYFEKCFEEFRKDPSLGVGGGIICHDKDGVLEAEVGPRFHVRGCTKIYRRAFWDVSGGLLAAPGWDTLDEVKANMLGWSTRSFEDIRIVHRRLTGSADGNWKNWFKNGRANYITGYHPLFMTVKCLKRVFEKPMGIAAAGLFCGFMSGYIRRVPQVPDPELIRYVRRQQLRRLFFRKSIWN